MMVSLINSINKEGLLIKILSISDSSYLWSFSLCFVCQHILRKPCYFDVQKGDLSFL